ncbi:MAG TPA: GNAT family N-acetyltransferase [Rhodocyclaceae bacterium]|nr:GNAT family N-acetyltransferase [Rhodocyclaceae bacterium]
MKFTIHPHIDNIPQIAWDALAPDQPFLRHTFFAALEDTACVGHGTGWQPAHAALWEGRELIAAAPMYRKHHSSGEYVFDWAWADAYQRHGLRYYPKWLCAVPFSPVPGVRLLARDEDGRRALLLAMLQHAEASDLSSLHILFPSDTEARIGEDIGMMRRDGVQFHWHNAGYRHFEDFLAALSHDKRKKIRQERRKVVDANVISRVLEGTNIREADWAFFAKCYAMTYALHGATPYLNLDFFLQLGQTMADACVLIIGARDGRDIAASFLIRDREALYGRYWGAVEYVPCLHFEVCYYRSIEYAIDSGIARFEGGAQGEHKLARGLDPVRTQSLHWIADERFRDAVAHFLARETGGMEQYINELEEHRPYAKRDPAP